MYRVFQDFWKSWGELSTLVKFRQVLEVGWILEDLRRIEDKTHSNFFVLQGLLKKLHLGSFLSVQGTSKSLFKVSGQWGNFILRLPQVIVVEVLV